MSYLLHKNNDSSLLILYNSISFGIIVFFFCLVFFHNLFHFLKKPIWKSFVLLLDLLIYLFILLFEYRSIDLISTRHLTFDSMTLMYFKRPKLSQLTYKGSKYVVINHYIILSLSIDLISIQLLTIDFMCLMYFKSPKIGQLTY